MKKRFIALTLLCAMLLCTTAAAVNARISYIPSLEFSGTTAHCTVTITSPSDEISATLELWQGNTLVDSWEDTNMHYLFIDEYCTVTKGKSYTLTVYGTISGVPFDEYSITRTCS